MIFITGNSRSGTTMMSRILGNNDAVFTFQELHFFDEISSAPESVISRKRAIELYATLCSIQRKGYFSARNTHPYMDEADKNISDIINTPVAVYYKFLEKETLANQKLIFCEQTPQNIFYLDIILRNIPQSKIIVMVRDPREVLLSQKNKWKRKYLTKNNFPLIESIRSRINYHPITISRIWRSVLLSAKKYKDNSSVIIVRYEDVINDPEITLRKICNFSNLSFSTTMLDIPVKGSSNFNDSENQRGISKNKSGLYDKGGLNKTEIYICQQIAKEEMLHYGYKPDDIMPNFFLLTWYQFTMPLRLGLALFLNLKRLKNPRKLIKRFF